MSAVGRSTRSKGTLSLEPSARLQQFLGRELIADPDLAIVEFVKNAYDAGATEVAVDFTLRNRTRGKQKITISDNGSGMDLATFEENWMKPGFSAKAAAKEIRQLVDAASDIGRRVPLGEKGLGRFAAGRLGDRLDVFTRERSEAPWLHVVFDWEAFSDMETPLRKVPIPFDYNTQPANQPFTVGTVIEISNLTLSWSGRIPGRRVPGRTEWRLGRLREDLSILVLPLAPAGENFNIVISTDDSRFNQFHGVITPQDPAVPGYIYDFEFSKEGNAAVVQRRLRRSSEIASIVGKKKSERSRHRLPKPSSPDETSQLRSGVFRGTFYYSPPQISARDFGVLPGVFLYRDGARVDPYGHDSDDWLGARAWKAKRQGHAPIQPNRLRGHVEISKKSNPLLVDMSNRQGLVENEAFEDFIVLTRGEFEHFAGIVLTELVEPGWEKPAAKALRAAERAELYKNAVIRAQVHSLRQPLVTLSTELLRLKGILKNKTLSDELRGLLQEIHDRARQQLNELDRLFAELLETGAEIEVEQFYLDALLQDVMARVESLASETDTAIKSEGVRKAQVVGPREVLIGALTELVRNAIQAPRPKGRSPEVDIKVQSANGLFEIHIADNGSGFRGRKLDDLLTGVWSTKGRPGAGLRITKEGLALFRASIKVGRTDSNGTVMIVNVPSVADVVRERRLKAG